MWGGFLHASDTCWLVVLSDCEIECNPACQIIQVYLLPVLLSSSHLASSFLFSTLMERCLYLINWKPRAWKQSMEHTSFDQDALTCVSSVSRQYSGFSELSVLSHCHHSVLSWVLCWLERLKHLADSTLRAGENVSAWLSAWRCKTRERGKLGQGCKVCVWGGYLHLFDSHGAVLGRVTSGCLCQCACVWCSV